MPKETIYLYHTPKEKAIEYLVSNYGFKPAPTQENSFASNYIGLVPIPSIMELGALQRVKLKIEKKDKLLKITITTSYRLLNIIFAIIIPLTVGLTLFIFTWPYVFLFILLPFIFYFAGLLNFQAHFFSFCERLKKEILNPENHKS